MTALEFEARYAEGAGVTVDGLREIGLVVIPCHCDYERCQGWASVPAGVMELYKEMGWVDANWSWPPTD